MIRDHADKLFVDGLQIVSWKVQTWVLRASFMAMIAVYFFGPGPAGYVRLTANYQEPFYLGGESNVYAPYGDHITTFLGSFPQWPAFTDFPKPDNGTCQEYKALTIVGWDGTLIEPSHSFEVCNPADLAGLWVKNK